MSNTLKDFKDFVYAIKNNVTPEWQRLYNIEYINMRDDFGREPIYWACSKGNRDLVRRLLDDEANADNVDNFGMTALSAACRNGHADVVPWLLDRGASVEKRDIFGRTPPFVACMDGHTDTVRCLLERDANVEIKDMWGRTPLYIACKRGHTDIVQCLLDGGANIESENNYGRTPLYTACKQGHSDIVRCLLERGANTECEDYESKFRPIHVSIHQGNVSVVTELINHKCLLTAITKDGKTALALALDENKTECATILYEAMKEPPPELLPSIGDYTKEQSLGRGAYGQVFKCLENKSQMCVAIKAVSLLPNQVKSLEKEVDIYKMLPLHSNIVRYFGTMKDEDMMYIVMEFVDGESLRHKLERISSLDIDLTALYSYQILEGLKFLHTNNIIHRDIKALNILINSKDYLKLCDFGVSRYLRPIETTSEAADCHWREMAGTCIGSAFYMAPEVLTDESYTISADVWSLGATVVEMFTGHPPYYDLGPQRAKIKIGITKKVEYKCERPIPDDLQSFLDSMFVAEPEKRATVESLLKSTFIMERKMIRHLDDGVYVDGLINYSFSDTSKFMDARINEYYVIKLLLTNEGNSLKKDIEIYTTMSKHPNVVPYFGLLVDKWGIKIFSEYVNGLSMKDMLDQGLKVTINDCARYTKQLLEGLHFLHQNDIIHGNIKASNIIVNINGTVKLSDYGLMMYLETLFRNSFYQPKFDRYMLPHSHWMAPETILDRHYTVYSDVWSVAVTIIEMLTGNPIFSKEQPKDVLNLLFDTNNIKKEYPASIPDELRNLLDSIFVYDATERPLVETLLQSKFFTTIYCDTEERSSPDRRGASCAE